MSRIYIAVLLACTVLAIAGCPKPQSAAGTASTASAPAQPGSPDAGRVSQSTPPPADSTKNATPPPAQLPANWPAELPQYPGSTVTASTTNSQSGGVFMALMMRTTDSPDKVLAFYEKTVVAVGYTKKVSIGLPGGGGTASYEKGNKSLSVKADRPEGETETGVQLLLKYKSDEWDGSAPPAGKPGENPAPAPGQSGK